MKLNFPKAKKGQGSNYLAVIIAIIFFGFMSILSYTIWLYFRTGFLATGLTTATIEATMNHFTTAFAILDYLIVFFMIILIIGIGLTSYKLPTRTAFFIVTLIQAVFWGFISYFFNYIFIQMVSPAIFATTIGVFPRTLVLCTNLHWIMLVMIVVGSITLYGKKEKGQYLT